MSLLSIDVVCVKECRSLWTILFSSVRLSVPYGIFSLVALGCLGLCLDELSTCLLVGGLLVVLGVVLCIRWCPIVFCCVFGGKEMI